MKVYRSLLVAFLLVPTQLSTAGADETKPTQASPSTPFSSVTAADRSFLNQAVLDDMMGQAMGDQAVLRPGSARFTAHATLMRTTVTGTAPSSP